MAYRTYSPFNYVVDQTPGAGDFTTLTACNSYLAANNLTGKVIGIKAGTYAESFTISQGSNTFCGMPGANWLDVVINGQVLVTGTNVSFSDIQFANTSGISLNIQGARARVVNCNLEAYNGNAAFATSGSGSFFMQNCIGTILSASTPMFTLAGGASFIQACFFYNGSSSTPATIANNFLGIDNSSLFHTLRTSSGGSVSIKNSYINTSAFNIYSYYHDSTDTTTTIANCVLNSGTDSAIYVESGAVTCSLNTITSSNANAITGSGTINIGPCSFTGSFGINVSTIVAIPIGDFGFGTTGQALISQGAGNLPVWGTPPASAAFSATKSADATNVTGDGTFYNIICDSVSWNIGGNYNNSTGQFTAPSTGYYFFNIGCYVTNCTIANEIALVLATTAQNYAIINVRAASNLDYTFQITFIASMTAGDTAYPGVVVDGEASNSNTVHGNSAYNATYFQGYQI